MSKQKKRFLNPAQKGKKFANELRWGRKLTNDNEFKTNKNGDYVALSNVERAYRSGYLASRSDNARAYKASQRKQ